MHDLRQLAELAELADLHVIPRNVIIERSNPFEDLNTQEFVERFRLSNEAAMMVLEKIKPRMGRIRNQRGSPIPHHLQCLVAFQLSMGDCHEMSQPTVSRCVNSVSLKIADLAVEYITFPQPVEEEVAIQQFSLTAGMPGVFGCVDGTHIPIKSRGGGDVEFYRCRKGFFSLSVQGVYDSHLKFTNIVVSWPGSAHDARIFNELLFCQRLQGGYYRGFLLGENGYPCRSYLLTPFLSPRSDKERNYIFSHIRIGNTIERAFGLLKRKFAVLSIPMRIALENSKKAIIACAVLHNIAVLHRVPFDDFVTMVQDNPPPPPHSSSGSTQ